MKLMQTKRVGLVYHYIEDLFNSAFAPYQPSYEFITKIVTSHINQAIEKYLLKIQFEHATKLQHAVDEAFTEIWSTIAVEWYTKNASTVLLLNSLISSIPDEWKPPTYTKGKAFFKKFDIQEIPHQEGLAQLSMIITLHIENKLVEFNPYFSEQQLKTLSQKIGQAIFEGMAVSLNSEHHLK